MVTIAEAKKWLRKYESLNRIQHSERVVETALSLYKVWGGNKDVLLYAGFLHDVARDLPFPELFRIAEENGYIPDEIEAKNPVLLHAPVGAILVRNELGIKDVNILNCIKYHTTGRKGITLNEALIYLADFIEPGRNFSDASYVRNIAFKNLKEALLEETRLNVDYLMKAKKPVHPRTIEMFNFLLEKQLTKREIKI